MNKRTITGASGSDVMNEAAKFDSDLRTFMVQLDGDPILVKRLYYTPGFDEAKKEQYLAFLSVLSGISYDWWGDDDAVYVKIKDPTDEQKGYYRVLKDMWYRDSDDYNRVLAFEDRLADAIKLYEKISGNKLVAKPTIPKVSLDPTKWSPAQIVWSVLGLVGLVGAGYVGFQIWKVKRFTSGTARAALPPASEL